MREESYRTGGEPEHPHDPQLPLHFGPTVPAPGTPGGDGTSAYGDPYASGPAGSAHSASATGEPVDPPQYPAAPPAWSELPPPQVLPPHRRRARRPYALLAAVAVAAGVIGGGAGALIGNATGDSGKQTAASVAAATTASKIDGSVASVTKAVDPSVVEINATSADGKATGSGVIITSDGQIVTNNHVIAGAQSVSVTYTNGRSASATVVGADPQKDLALIKVQGASGLPAATLGDSNAVAVGDQVVAIGSPEGLSNTVTSGIVSALNRDVTVPVEDGQSVQNNPFGGNSGRWPFSFGGNQFNGDTGSSTTTYKAIQTDASLNPGNSGGALINMSGQIIGINAAMFSDSSSSSGGDSSTAGSVGLGFAIPINTVKADLAHLRAGGTN
ncbi:S1C family serine protease [Actinacidiphila acididurans]|uniref:Trypsin-like peptidase domain-containing protein n=1 Tax=Actinacidiphila acididurans TaxID=2784346 RepID=A0ABS2TYN5_9ACTN|nr:trypsin-like peptidase domain-containing protein [Actinacidiphila acididurans]MBM9508446.1 trypsin-like peptidase domain-containing protein [Actinacidiphila acididurans]